MKKKHIRKLKNGHIKVLTPIPYIVGCLPDESIYRLEQNVQFLYDCFKLLGISKKNAIKNSFTLNLMTGDKLMSLAREKNISHEMIMTIKNHNW